jgi:hypothetical protein
MLPGTGPTILEALERLGRLVACPGFACPVLGVVRRQKKKVIRKKWKWECRKGEKRDCVTSTQCRRRFKSQRLSCYHLILYACLTLLSISIPRGRLNPRKFKQRGRRVMVRWEGGLEPDLQDGRCLPPFHRNRDTSGIRFSTIKWN